MKLSWVESKRYVGWTKWIGRTAANGKPRCFYLGKDRTEAELKAVKLTLAYKRLVAAGAAGWTEDAIKSALDTPAMPPFEEDERPYATGWRSGRSGSDVHEPSPRCNAATVTNERPPLTVEQQGITFESAVFDYDVGIATEARPHFTFLRIRHGNHSRTRQRTFSCF